MVRGKWGDSFYSFNRVRMYAKLLIKGAILLLVINVALVGVITSRLARLAVAIFNLIALFVLLFQERNVFQTAPPTNKRILFTDDVFGRISVGIGVIVWGLSAYRGTGLPPLLGGVLGGGLFYLLTVAFFNLTEGNFWKEGSVRVVGTVVLLILLGVIAQRIGIISVSGLGRSYDTIVSWWQRSLQGIVVDREVGLPPEEEDDDEIIIIPPPTTGDAQLPAATGDNVTGSLVVPDNDQTREREFMQSDRLQEGSLTFANFLPILFRTYNIAPSSNDYIFPTVSESNSLYPSFVLARDYTMIGNNTNPQSVITCQTLMVILGLVEGRNLNYTSATVLDVFRAEGGERGYTAYGCTDRDAVAQRENLP